MSFESDLTGEQPPMEQWEIDLRAKLDKEIPHGMYEIGTPGIMVAWTGKEGYINYLVELHRAASNYNE